MPISSRSPIMMRIEVGFRLGFEPINQERYGDGKATTTRKTDANQDYTVNPMPRFFVPKNAKTKGDGKRRAEQNKQDSINESFIIWSERI